jgi:hypothetical protein
VAKKAKALCHMSYFTTQGQKLHIFFLWGGGGASVFEITKQESDEFSCATPTLELVSKEETLSKIMQTHSWQVVKAEPYGTDGFLTKIVCIKCGLERIALITNTIESSSVARKKREKNSEE